MSDGLFIRDIHSLEELNNIIGFTGEAMAKIEESVSKYIDGVQQVLDKQQDIIRQNLDEARQRLENAQKALSACYSSQTYDEDSGEYTPSCDCEERDVESAQKEVDEWQKKLEEGEKIIGECKLEIDEYNDPGGAISPPGGHYLIENMCQSQTPNATQSLQEFIAEAHEYAQSDLGGERDIAPGTYNSFVSDDDLPMTEEEKAAAFDSNIQGVKDEQESSSRYYDIQDANRAMCCPSCGRPLQMCSCNIMHVDVNLYQ